MPNRSLVTRAAPRIVPGMSAQHANSDIASKAALVRDALSESVRRFGRVVYSNSLGAEAMVLTDIICRFVPDIEMFTIDTGRLHEETYELLERVERRYGRRLRVVYPDSAALERLVSAAGISGFYGSVEARVACCRARKVEPFRRAVAGYAAWVTGVRHEQSTLRAGAQPVEWDDEHGLYKISPILDWSAEQVWRYVRAHDLPYNVLHDRGYPSIGCAPCTRAIQPGEDPRAGRWWWEQAESRECGLHPRIRVAVEATPA
jgi:phosphoadenosine phosphosulfate reductase